jgi:hypothetical protein
MIPRFGGQQTTTPEAEALLDDQLHQVASHLNAQQRIALAARFARWANQLEKSACKMNPQLMITPKKNTKGFFQINLAKREQSELRELARECGMELRLAIRHAIWRLRDYLKEEVRMNRLTGLSARDRELALGTYNPRVLKEN